MELQIIQNKIYEIRGQQVMLDFDLAMLYQVETKRLKEQVKRNSERFPEDFMFILSEKEWSEGAEQKAHLTQKKFSPSFDVRELMRILELQNQKYKAFQKYA